MSKVIHGYTKEYFIEALYNSKKVYFLKVERYYSDKKKIYRTLMEVHEGVDLIFNGKLTTINIWYDLY